MTSASVGGVSVALRAFRQHREATNASYRPRASLHSKASVRGGYQGLGDLEYPFHGWTAIVSRCGRIYYKRRQSNLSRIFADRKVGVSFSQRRVVMEGRSFAPAYWTRVAVATGLAVAVCNVLTTGFSAQQPAAQQAAPAPRVRFNTIAERFEKGEPSFNGEAWENLPDQEHSAFRLDDLEAALAALKPAGAPRPLRTPVVRIQYEADQDYKHVVKQLLDVGVMGIIVPGVETAEQALYLVRSMRYPPQRTTKPQFREPPGFRGYAPGLAVAYWGWTPNDYAAGADTWPLNPDGELMAIAMIETPMAVRNIRKILGVPGLGAILIGQGDLSMAIGVGNPGAVANHPEVEAQVAEVAKACVEMKKLCGSYQGDVNTRLAQGFRLFTSQRPKS